MSDVPPKKMSMHLHTVQQQLFLDDYYGWFYGWAKVPADTYKADLALLAWLHAELSWKFHEHGHRGGGE